MRVTERDKRRLAALATAIKPDASLAARIEHLTVDKRAHYERWRQRQNDFLQRYRDGEAYARIIEGYGPKLREDIATLLYGTKATILQATSDDDAARIYKDYCDDL
ncbi:hypothetical protein IVB41_21920 [Bradyrhizobium sp. 44]|uniref:hypothetical protein n=1 Tax=Bradyrhizobium sp. 44 TaxID=2782675 RepID=UPI001FF76446|nr:hypothetical protein [Bradyrhizobium sp. 44]MCK1286582.1 hypothetical protein [Bradyrhizobium sp. 44]